MMAAEVQEHHEDRKRPHPKPKRSDSLELYEGSGASADIDSMSEVSWDSEAEIGPFTWPEYDSPMPGHGAGIPDRTSQRERQLHEMERQNRAVADLGRKLGALNFFKGLNGTLSMTRENEMWLKLIITVDSGATDSVAPPASASNVPIVDSPGSRAGATYEVANGEIIHNLGQKDCIIATDVGDTPQQLSFQICEVHKPLLSVSKLLAVGKSVVFHPHLSYIEDLKTG